MYIGAIFIVAIVMFGIIAFAEMFGGCEFYDTADDLLMLRLKNPIAKTVARASFVIGSIAVTIVNFMLYETLREKLLWTICVIIVLRIVWYAVACVIVSTLMLTWHLVKKTFNRMFAG